MSVCTLSELFPDGVRAVFSDRRGGFSSPPYQGYNLGDHVGDNPADVAKNRADFVSQLPASPCWLNQVHSTRVVDVSDSAALGASADASISRLIGAPCVVMTADCLPVLLCDRQARVVAAAHAGWRGLADGVLENTVNLMATEPSSLTAWLGPAIGPNHFQVGPEVRETFLRWDAQAQSAFSLDTRQSLGTVDATDGPRYLADLKRLAYQRLDALGVGQIHVSPDCTYTQADRFFSYRLEGRTGRMAAAIWLE
jgi:YfiH family protein